MTPAAPARPSRTQKSGDRVEVAGIWASYDLTDVFDGFEPAENGVVPTLHEPATGRPDPEKATIARTAAEPAMLPPDLPLARTLECLGQERRRLEASAEARSAAQGARA